MSAFFSKQDPQFPLRINTEKGFMRIKFTEVGFRLGVYGTDDDKLIKAIKESITENPSGVTEITEAQFKELLEKKSPVSRPQWREEFSLGDQQDTSGPRPAPPAPPPPPPRPSPTAQPTASSSASQPQNPAANAVVGDPRPKATKEGEQPKAK